MTMARPPGPRPPLDPDDARRLLTAARARAAILVEGWSDQAALEALARRRGRDLPAEGVVVVPIGGATNVQRFVQALGPHGMGLRLAGLCDIAELRHVRRSLERGGVVASAKVTTDDGTGDDGFYACDADLEDELIRALGTVAVERVRRGRGRARVLASLPGPARAARPRPAFAAAPLPRHPRRAQGALRRAARGCARPRPRAARARPRAGPCALLRCP